MPQSRPSTAAVARPPRRPGRVVERFGVDRMVDRYVEVYERAIADARH